MNSAKRKRLAAAGWKAGSVQKFLGLSDEEAAIVEMKLALSDAVKKHRASQNISQQALATKIGSSQSRVAKLEAGDPSVSLDLLVRAALAAGATKKELAKAIAS